MSFEEFDRRLDAAEDWSETATVAYELLEYCRKLETFVEDIRHAHGCVSHYKDTEEAFKKLGVKGSD